MQLEDSCISNSSCNEVTNEGQLVQVDFNNNILQEDADTSASLVQSKLLVKEHDSNILNSDNAKVEVLFQNSSSIEQQGQMLDWIETIDSGIVLSSLSFKNPVGSLVSTYHDKSLNKNNPNE